MAGSRKAVQDLSPKIRMAFIRACARKDKEGDAVNFIASKLGAMMDKDFLAVLNAMSKFNPKEAKGELNVSSTLIDILTGIDARTASDPELEERPGEVRH